MTTTQKPFPAARRRPGRHRAHQPRHHYIITTVLVTTTLTRPVSTLLQGFLRSVARDQRRVRTTPSRGIKWATRSHHAANREPGGSGLKGKD